MAPNSSQREANTRTKIDENHSRSNVSMRKSSGSSRHVENGHPVADREVGRAAAQVLDLLRLAAGQAKAQHRRIHVAFAADFDHLAVGAFGVEDMPQAAPAQRQAAGQEQAADAQDDPGDPPPASIERPRAKATLRSRLPGRWRSGVDDGHEPLALRRRGIEELLARRRLGEPAELHQGAHVLAARQPVLARAVAEEQPEHLALAQKTAQLRRRHVDQEAGEDPDLDGHETTPGEVVHGRVERRAEAAVRRWRGG